MLNRCNRKWKRISIYDETSNTIHFELDENEKLIQKNKRSKKVSSYTKELTLKRKILNDPNINENPKLELSLNTIIFSRESITDQNNFNFNENANNLINNEFTIMDFQQVDLMVQNDFEDWSDCYLFR